MGVSCVGLFYSFDVLLCFVVVSVRCLSTVIDVVHNPLTLPFLLILSPNLHHLHSHPTFPPAPSPPDS